MENERLYCQTVRAMLKLKKAINLGFPADYIDKLDKQVSVYFEKLKKLGLMDAFADYVL